MNANLVRQWKQGREAANRIALEEARQRTPRERYENLIVYLNRLAAMNRLPLRHDDLAFHRRWQQVREAWLAKHAQP